MRDPEAKREQKIFKGARGGLLRILWGGCPSWVSIGEGRPRDDRVGRPRPTLMDQDEIIDQSQ